MEMPSFQPTDVSQRHQDAQADQLRMLSLQKNGKMTEGEMRDVATQFEEIIVRQLMKAMRKTVPDNGFIEQSFATEMYMNIADDHLSKQMASAGGFGLGVLVYQELKEKNDHLASQKELDEESSFVNLQKEKENKFMPMNEPLSTDQFLQLNQGSGMIPLPNKEESFVPLGTRTRISTSQIEPE